MAKRRSDEKVPLPVDVLWSDLVDILRVFRALTYLAQSAKAGNIEHSMLQP
jgi:hypothetical protein